MSVRHFVDLWKLEGADLRAILEDAKARKAARLGWPKGRFATPCRRSLAAPASKSMRWFVRCWTCCLTR